MTNRLTGFAQFKIVSILFTASAHVKIFLAYKFPHPFFPNCC